MNFGIDWVCAPQFTLPNRPGVCKFGFFLDETKVGDATQELHHSLMLMAVQSLRLHCSYSEVETSVDSGSAQLFCSAGPSHHTAPFRFETLMAAMMLQPGLWQLFVAVAAL